METPADAASLLEAGAAILASVLSPAGFVFERMGQGRGSGGEFAAGRFTRDGQYIEVHVRRSLGLVSYGWDGAAVSHSEYLSGLGMTGAYPGYSDDPLDGFRHLALDLAGPLSEFVSGDRHGYDRASRSAHRPRDKRLP